MLYCSGFVLAWVETHSAELTEGPAEGNLAPGLLQREGGSWLVFGLADSSLL